jgi:hypothetical protein
MGKHQVEGYFRYVDDILTMYKENKTNIHDTVNIFSNLMPNMNFAWEKETGNKINFLDLTITKDNKNFSFDIYRKPTTTDILIPSDSCHQWTQAGSI